MLCVGHLGDMIEAVVGDGSRFGLKVSYSMDGPVLLGTGGALRRASGLLGQASFVLYGDSYLPVDFSAIEAEFEASRQPALMTVLRNQDRWDKSNVLFVGGKLLEYNKAAPRADFAFIDYGLTIVKPQILESYPANQSFDLAALYHRLSLEGRLHGCQVFDRFYEIGSPNGLRKLMIFLRWKTTHDLRPTAHCRNDRSRKQDRH